MIPEVRKEAEFLRDNLTKEEKDRIVLEKLNGWDSELCIYGLATGDCFSERSEYLTSLQGFKSGHATDIEDLLYDLEDLPVDEKISIQKEILKIIKSEADS